MICFVEIFFHRVVFDFASSNFFFDFISSSITMSLLLPYKRQLDKHEEAAVDVQLESNIRALRDLIGHNKKVVFVNSPKRQFLNTLRAAMYEKKITTVLHLANVISLAYQYDIIDMDVFNEVEDGLPSQISVDDMADLASDIQKIKYQEDNNLKQVFMGFIRLFHLYHIDGDVDMRTMKPIVFSIDIKILGITYSKRSFHLVEKLAKNDVILNLLSEFNMYLNRHNNDEGQLLMYGIDNYSPAYLENFTLFSKMEKKYQKRQ